MRQAVGVPVRTVDFRPGRVRYHKKGDRDD
jgi:hypothetical protein